MGNRPLPDAVHGHAGFEVGGWRVEPSTFCISCAGRSVKLEPRVMELLVFLADRAGEVVTLEHLEAGVWRGRVVGYDAVATTVIKLRKAFGDTPRDPKVIKTIPKAGYQLIARVTAPTGNEGPGTERPKLLSTASPRSGFVARLLPLALILLVVVIGVFLWRGDPARIPANLPDQGGVEPASLPSVAVLPFENMSGDESQRYFSDGITEDLITDLSKLSGLRVVARNSIRVYRNSEKTDRQIGSELDARYIVRGSVQRDGERLRINVRLTDAADDRNRWAERYDREFADIFPLQDEIAARVVSALQIELAPGEQRRLNRKYVASVEAYDQFLRGLDLLGRRSEQANADAKAHFENAIALEPRFARAFAGLAQAYSQDAVYDRGPKVLESLQKAETLARHGLELDASLPQLHFVIGMVAMFKGDLQLAITEVSRAIELKPSYADGYGLLARILHFAGKPQEGLEAIRQAIRLNPRVPAIYRMVRGSLLYQLEKHDEALEQLLASLESSPNQLLSRLYLAAVYSATNQPELAGWEVEEILAYNPDFTLAYLDYGFPIRDPELRQRFTNDLRRAGLKEN